MNHQYSLLTIQSANTHNPLQKTQSERVVDYLNLYSSASVADLKRLGITNPSATIWLLRLSGYSIQTYYIKLPFFSGGGHYRYCLLGKTVQGGVR
jgi:hypothetical protein